MPLTLLSSEEKNVLARGALNLRKYWQDNGDNWIADTIFHSHIGFAGTCDEVIVETALGSNCVINNLNSDEDRLTVGRLLTRPDILAILSETNAIAPQDLLTNIGTLCDQMQDSAKREKAIRISKFIHHMLVSKK